MIADRFAKSVILSWGWRRRGIAFAAGALSALALPPFFVFPLLWLTFPVLVWLLDGAGGSNRRGDVRRLASSFTAGWWFGFGYFLAGLWWIGAAFLVDADTFAWLLPFAVLALPAGLALFWGLGAALAQLLWSAGPGRIFALAAGLGTAEWFRGHVLTGFPWNAVGYALTGGEVMLQSAALLSVEGLTVLAIIVFASPAALAPASPRGRRAWMLPAFSGLAIIALAASGIARLLSAETAFVQAVRVRIVQPAIPQDEKWRPENRELIFQSYLDLSRPEDRPALHAGDVLVWPESAFPFVLTEEAWALTAIADLLPDGAALVTGAARVERVPGEPRRVFNSVYVIDGTGTIEGSYDKVHLVPFGEYLPMQASLERLGLQQLTRIRGGFEAGPRMRTLTLPAASLSFVPLICYEIIFPSPVSPDGPRPRFLLNVTNDSWFGRTPGPYQHLHQARVRAVEEGLPLVRAANSGISIVTDAYGRIAARLPLGERGTLDAALPAIQSKTFAARTGGYDVIFLLMISFAGAILALVSRRA